MCEKFVYLYMRLMKNYSNFSYLVLFVFRLMILICFNGFLCVFPKYIYLFIYIIYLLFISNIYFVINKIFYLIYIPF